jgi:multidrug resistance efflux pump
MLALTLLLLPAKLFHPTADVSNAPATQPAVQAAEHHGPTDVKKPTLSVHRGSLTTSIDAQGYFEPANSFEVRIRPKTYTGELTINSIVGNGAAIKKGDLILELDPVTIDKQLKAAENDVMVAHANLTKAQADAKIVQEQEELAMKMTTAAAQRAADEVKWFQKVDGPNILVEADLNVKNAKASVDDQQDELNELKKMYKSDDLTTNTADIVVKRAVRNLENAKVVYKIQQDRTSKIKTAVYPAREDQVLDAARQSEQQLELLKTAQTQSKVLREAGLVTALAATKAADEHFADLKADKEKLTVRAPADGVVVYGQFAGGALQNADERSFRVGEKITAQQPVMTFYTPGKLRLHVDLPEAKFYSIHSGSRATLTPVAFADEKIEGTCDRSTGVPVTSQQGPQFSLTVSCPSVDSKVVPGMRASFHAEVADSDNGILVPASALADGRVSVKTEDGFEWRPVVIGKSDGKHTEIKQGLNEGEEIFVEAQK